MGNNLIPSHLAQGSGVRFLREETGTSKVPFLWARVSKLWIVLSPGGYLASLTTTPIEGRLEKTVCHTCGLLKEVTSKIAGYQIVSHKNFNNSKTTWNHCQTVFPFQQYLLWIIGMIRILSLLKSCLNVILLISCLLSFPWRPEISNSKEKLFSLVKNTGTMVWQVSQRISCFSR